MDPHLKDIMGFAPSTLKLYTKEELLGFHLVGRGPCAAAPAFAAGLFAFAPAAPAARERKRRPARGDDGTLEGQTALGGEEADCRRGG